MRTGYSLRRREVPRMTAFLCSSEMRKKWSTAAMTRNRGDSLIRAASSATCSARSSGSTKASGLVCDDSMIVLSRFPALQSAALCRLAFRRAIQGGSALNRIFAATRSPKNSPQDYSFAGQRCHGIFGLSVRISFPRSMSLPICAFSSSILSNFSSGLSRSTR